MVSWIGIGAAVVAMNVIGFLWYGPLFGKMWMELVGMTKKDAEKAKKEGCAKQMTLMVGSSIVMAYVLSMFVPLGTEMNTALMTAFWIWLGFIATVMLAPVAWQKMPWKLYWLNSLHYLVGFLVMAAILSMW